MPRKGENIYKRKDGRWEGRYIKSREGVKTKYGYVYDRTYMGVKQRLSEIKTGQIDKKNENLNSNITIKSISEQWILEKKATLKYSSYIKYRNTLEHYIIPHIGQDNISNVSYDTISSLIVNLLTKAGRGENGISQKTVADSITVVKSIIKYAARNKYEVDSSALDVILRTKGKPLRVLSKQEQERLVEHLLVNIHDQFCRGILICLFTGIRIGELCALKWGDISSEEHMINVNKTLQRVQTPNGERNHFSEDALDLYKNLNLREEAEYNARDYPVDTEWTYNIGPNTYYKYNYMDICRIGYIVRSESIEIENTINTIRDKYLNPLYDIGIIHPKYRNMIAIASFVDYFETGRVEKLKGSDGAYNLFEQELRANIIISELKKINESLEIIKSNQYALYTELKEVRKITEQIGEEQRKRAKEVSTFNECMKKMVGSVMKNSEIAARCTKTIKYLTILNTVL